MYIFIHLFSSVLDQTIESQALGLMGIEGSADSYGLCLLDRMKGRRIEKETDGDRKDCTILVRII